MSRNLEMKFKKLKQSQLWNHKNPNLLELDSDVLYEYNNIHIHSGCTLTVKPWLGRTEYKRIRKEHLNKTYSIDPHKIDILISYWNNHTIPHYSTDIQQLILSYISKESRDFLGGRLLLKCKGNIIIEKGGKIDVDSCGYTSGTYYTSGESCKNMGTFNNISPNVGGGGAGLARCGAGGGGYGTIGGHGKMTDDVKSAIEHTGKGGETYGNKYLTVLYLGSGGGGSECNLGGDGGGAIYLECNKLINYGHITANGGDAMIGSGAGSGGSIHINVKDTIRMDKNSLIQAKGGYGGKWGLYGNGGHGRIRIDIDRKYHQMMGNIMNLKRIHPRPYINECM
eukprot:111888_1